MHTQETIKVVPARYPLRAVGALLALLVLAVGGSGCLTAAAGLAFGGGAALAVLGTALLAGAVAAAKGGRR